MEESLSEKFSEGFEEVLIEEMLASEEYSSEEILTDLSLSSVLLSTLEVSSFEDSVIDDIVFDMSSVNDDFIIEESVNFVWLFSSFSYSFEASTDISDESLVSEEALDDESFSDESFSDESFSDESFSDESWSDGLGSQDFLSDGLLLESFDLFFNSLGSLDWLRSDFSVKQHQKSLKCKENTIKSCNSANYISCLLSIQGTKQKRVLMSESEIHRRKHE